MKKKIGIILVMAAMLLTGSMTTAKAQDSSSSYWGKYLGTINFGQYSELSFAGIQKWEDANHTFYVGGGYGSGYGTLYFSPRYTDNLIFSDVTNVTAKSSNNEVLTVEVKPYDFSYEKKHLQEFIDKYNKLSFEEFKEIAKNEDGEDVSKYQTKPQWWEYAGKNSEPTWWEAYGLSKEPQNAVILDIKAKNLPQDVYITLSADGKQDIKINWSTNILKFGNDMYGNKSEGLVYILNNFDKYKSTIYHDGKYSVDYVIEDSEDLSGIINALKGKDVTVKFKKYDGLFGEYSLNGKDIKTTVGKGFTYDYKVSMNTSINKDKISSLVDLNNALFIDFTYHGVLPAKYTLKLSAKDYVQNEFVKQLKCSERGDAEIGSCYNEASKKADEYLKANKFTLLYYNPDTNKMEVVKENLTPNADGKFELEFDHFSSYVLVGSDNYKITNNASNNAQTSSISLILYSILTIGSLAGIVYLVVSRKKKEA